MAARKGQLGRRAMKRWGEREGEPLMHGAAGEHGAAEPGERTWLRQ